MTNSTEVPNDDQGFTVLEALIAVTLCAIIATMLTGAIPTTIAALSRAQTASDLLEEDRTLQFVREMLARSRPVMRRGPDGAPLVWFTGAAERVVTIADLPAAGGIGGPHAVELAIENEPEGEGKRLILRRRYFPLSDADAVAESRLLLSGLQTASFRFSAGINTPNWIDAWQAKTDLPALIGLDLTAARWRQPQRLIVGTTLRPSY